MSKCLKCNVSLHINNDRCPLCHSKIVNPKKDSIFPEVKPKYKLHQLLLKIFLFTSLCGIVFSLMINKIVNKKLSWSIFVILGICTLWFTIITGIKKRHNLMKLLFAEILIMIIFAFLWDKSTGYHKWSLTFVLPFLCIAYIITFLILRIFTNKIKKEHILYTYLNALIGLFPLYSILKKNLTPLWPSYLSIFTSIFALIFLFIFNHRTLESEIERRLHI